MSFLSSKDHKQLGLKKNKKAGSLVNDERTPASIVAVIVKCILSMDKTLERAPERLLINNKAASAPAIMTPEAGPFQGKHQTSVST